MGCTRKMTAPTKAAIAAMGDLLGAEEIAVCNPPAGRSPAQGKRRHFTRTVHILKAEVDGIRLAFCGQWDGPAKRCRNFAQPGGTVSCRKCMELWKKNSANAPRS